MKINELNWRFLDNLLETKQGFTLAEVLITLGIIGVVAAVTIPTLVSNYKQKAWDTASYVFERKLEEALKTMNTQQTLAGYSNTLDFVNELNKHFKIIKICKNDDLMSCFEDKVMWGAGDAEPEEVDMTNIKTASNFGQEDWDTDIVGVQLANGTTGLIAYNPDCRQNPFSNQVTGTSCLAILYDTDGFKKPNTNGKDLRAINVNRLGNNCAVVLNGTCYGTAFLSPMLPKSECENLKDQLGLKYCFDEDYYAGPANACGGVGKLPSKTQLADIANYVYNVDNISADSSTFNLTLDAEKAAEFGIDIVGSEFGIVSIVSNEECDMPDNYGCVNNRTFESDQTSYRSDTDRDNTPGTYTICVLN